MAWFSLLPESFSGFETYIIRISIVLGILTIGPWALFVLYDFLLYLVRSATYEVPYVGGRARGRARPRAPSLSERPSGRPRTFSISSSVIPNPRLSGDGTRHRASSKGSAQSNEEVLFEEKET